MPSDNSGFLPPSPINGSRLPKEVLWKPGVSANPGGAPKGKRVSTWMAEFGEMDPCQWPDESSDRLPANARIALARLRRAMVEDGGEHSTKIILESTNDAGQLTPADSLPIIESISQAINALKQSGWKIPPKEIKNESVD